MTSIYSNPTMEILKYAVAVWNSFSGKQKQDIYDGMEWGL